MSLVGVIKVGAVFTSAAVNVNSPFVNQPSNQKNVTQGPTGGHGDFSVLNTFEGVGPVSVDPDFLDKPAQILP
ncbi:hypothetical protein [Salinithrix halophila]